jgi:hypothetical protein
MTGQKCWCCERHWNDRRRYGVLNLRRLPSNSGRWQGELTLGLGFYGLAAVVCLAT